MGKTEIVEVRPADQTTRSYMALKRRMVEDLMQDLLEASNEYEKRAREELRAHPGHGAFVHGPDYLLVKAPGGGYEALCDATCGISAIVDDAYHGLKRIRDLLTDYVDPENGPYPPTAYFREVSSELAEFLE